MSFDESFSWELACGKNGMPMIFKYDFDLGRQGSSTWRELMSFEFLT